VQYSTIQYSTKICNAQNVCQLAESEALAVAGGKWEISG